MKNIYQRISDVMKDIEYLTKDDAVVTGKDKNGKERTYKAITEEKVTSAVRAAMIKHGIVIIPIKQEHFRTDETVKAWNKYDQREEEKINRIATVNTKYRIQNIDDPQDYINAASSGTGVDTQDKGVGKAMTYSFKYLLLRMFAIPTGEDTDKISSDLYADKQTGATENEGEKPTEDAKSSDKYKPNVYDQPDQDQAAAEAMKAEMLTKYTERQWDAACMKKYKKLFRDLHADELKAAYGDMKRA